MWRYDPIQCENCFRRQSFCILERTLRIAKKNFRVGSGKPCQLWVRTAFEEYNVKVLFGPGRQLGLNVHQAPVPQIYRLLLGGYCF